jgi:hypothetical protein
LANLRREALLSSGASRIQNSGSRQRDLPGRIEVDRAVRQLAGRISRPAMIASRIREFIQAAALKSTSHPRTRRRAGLKITYQQQFRLLPTRFDGFGFLANATFSDGEARFPSHAGER